MNGVLSQFDPKTLALLQTGLGMMQASGPSRTPVSLGQAFGQAGGQGLQAYQQAIQAQQMEAFKKQQMAMEQERMEMERQRFARQQNTPLSYGPGTQLIRPGETQPFHTVPFRPEAPEKPQAPMTRKLRQGEEEVTQEYVDGKWQEVGRGPAFAKSVAGPAGAAPTAKPPTGYRYNAAGDALEAIPGGPKDTAPKEAARSKGAVQKADIVINKVNEALEQTGFFSTGLTGTVLGMVPGTGAYDLDKTVDTIKANLGFSELQAMREASPTGGALGQVAIQELAMLQSTVASLDKGQSEENLRRALSQVKTHFENWKKAVQEASGGTTPSFPTPPADAIRRLKMNPKEKEMFDQVFGAGAADRALGK